MGRTGGNAKSSEKLACLLVTNQPFPRMRTSSSGQSSVFQAVYFWQNPFCSVSQLLCQGELILKAPLELSHCNKVNHPSQQVCLPMKCLSFTRKPQRKFRGENNWREGMVHRGRWWIAPPGGAPWFLSGTAKGLARPSHQRLWF